MTDTVTRTRIEILVSQPFIRRIEDAAEAAGIFAWTLLPTLGGKGSGGRWTDDQLTGAEARVVFLSVTSSEKADRLTDMLGALLETHGLVILRSSVEVIRGGKFS